MKILFAVINDLSYDQRMHRICRSLALAGHEVTLVGRRLPNSAPLEERSFRQIRLFCFFKKGFAFYAEYNIRLFFYLLIARYDAVCSIDLDTLPAGCAATRLRGKKRAFDAHEYFTEVPEVVDRPFVKAFWERVGRICLPHYRYAYTVGPALAAILGEKYRMRFEVIPNMPLPGPLPQDHVFPENMPRILLYQGAVNEGRGIEALLKALQSLDNVKLVLAGEGDLFTSLQEMAKNLQLGDKVQFLGYVKPDALKKLTASAWLGLNLLENRGQSYYYSLANKFFDCVQAGVPVLTMDFPEYRAFNAEHEVAVLLEEAVPEKIVQAIRSLLNDEMRYHALRTQCLKAREKWHWGRVEDRLLTFWKNLESDG